MKALSILQPWAWLVVNGHKDIENRTWGTGFRGRSRHIRPEVRSIPGDPRGNDGRDRWRSHHYRLRAQERQRVVQWTVWLRAERRAPAAADATARSARVLRRAG